MPRSVPNVLTTDRLTRRALLICEMPIDWAEQERQFGFAA